MPHVVVDTNLGSSEEAADMDEVAPIANQLGAVPVMNNLDQILDPHAPAPTAE